MPLPVALLAICEALTTASTTTQPILTQKKNARFLSPCMLEIERAAAVGGATVWGVNLNGVSNANRQDFRGDGVATVYDSALAFVATSNYNWVLKVDKSTRTGTVTVTVGSTTVTGSGTAFTTELKVGAEIMVGSERKVIVSITSATVLNVDRVYQTANAAVAIFLMDDLLVPTTDYTISTNGGLARITLTAAAKLPAGATLELHFVVPVALFTFVTTAIIFKKTEVSGYDMFWYVSDATGTPSSTNVYVKAIIGE